MLVHLLFGGEEFERLAREAVSCGGEDFGKDPVRQERPEQPEAQGLAIRGQGLYDKKLSLGFPYVWS